MPYLTRENLPDTAAKVMFYGLTPNLLSWAIAETKSSGYLLNGGLKNLTIAQPLYRIYKINTRSPWSQRSAINDDNMHEKLFKILSAEGGQDQESLKWVFLKELFLMLPTHGNKDKVISSKSEISVAENDEERLRDVITELSVYIYSLDRYPEFLMNDNLDAYTGKIIDEMKDLLVSKFSTLQTDVSDEQASCSLL
jgi:hypothetical protein